MFVPILIFLLFIQSGESFSNCETFLVSNVELTDCNDGRCDLINRYSFETDINDGHKICLTDNNGKSNLDFPDVQIFFNNTNIKYNLFECYYTDDPTILLGSFCGCPLGTSVDCTNCPATRDKAYTGFCLSGTHAGADCPLSGSGTWCSQLMFQSTQRYKICKVDKPITQLTIFYQSDGDLNNKTVDFDTTTTFELKDALFKIYPITKEKSLEGYFTIQDTINDYSALIAPSNKVNDINQNDPKKLGWYKYNMTNFTDTVKSAFDPKINQCSQDKLYLGSYATKMSTAFLSGKYDAHIISPGAVLIDTGMPYVQEAYSYQQETVVPLDEGKYFYDTNWNPQPFGLTASHELPYSQTTIKRNTTIMTNEGDATGDFICSNYINIYRSSYSYNSGQVCLLPGTNKWGVCLKSRNFVTNYTETSCENACFLAYDYPSGLLGQWCFQLSDPSDNSPGWIQTADLSAYAPVVANPTLMTETIGIQYKVLFQTKKSNFKFESTNMKPHIEYADTSKGYVEMSIYSTGNDGNCIMSFDTDLLPSKEIQIEQHAKIFKFEYQRRQFHGEVKATVTCFKNADSVIFDLTVTKTDSDIDPLEIGTQGKARNISPINIPSKGWYALYILPTFWPSLLFGPVLSSIWKWGLNAEVPLSGNNLYWSVPGFCLTGLLLLWIIWKIYCWMSVWYWFRKIMWMEPKYKAKPSDYYKKQM